MLLLLLAACGCPEFDQVEFIDETGALSEAELSEYQAHLDWFAEATGLDGVCVGEVRVREEVESEGDAVGGYFSAMAQQIALDDDAPLSSFTHELCHGADFVLDRPSLDHPELFDPASVDNLELYETESARTREAFARACVAATYDIRVQAALAEECGEPLDTATHDFLREEVWRFYEDPPLDLAFEPVETGAAWDLGELVGDAYVLGAAGTERSIALLVANWPAGPIRPSAGLAQHRLQVLHIDPWTHELLSATHLRQARLGLRGLLHGHDAAWVLIDNEVGRGQAFRVPVEGGLEPAPIRDLTASGPDQGAVIDGLAFLLAAWPDSSDPDETPTVVDVASGELVSEHPYLPDDRLGVWWRLVAGPKGPYISVIDAQYDSLLVSLRDGETEAVGSGWGRGSPLAVRSDGVLYTERGFSHSAVDVTTSGLALVSPDESRLRLDPSICDQPSPRDRYAVQVGDAAWLIELQSTRGAYVTLRELPL